MSRLARQMIPLAVLAAVVFGGVEKTHAVVLDFDDITGFSQRSHLPFLGIANSYQGHQWPSPQAFDHWGVVENADPAFSSVGAFSGTQALWTWGGGAERDIIFGSLQDVDGAYFNVFEATQPWGAGTVRFRAYDELDNLIGTGPIVALDNVSDSPAWQWVPAGFTGVKRLNILATSGGTGEFWAMDDLTLSPSAPVPEPSTVFLLGIGVVGLIAFTRRTLR